MDEFELAEETPTKKPAASPPVAQPASPGVTDFQLLNTKLSMSADTRTAEWITALSPVMESDEGSPASADSPSSPEPSTTGLSSELGAALQQLPVNASYHVDMQTHFCLLWLGVIYAGLASMGMLKPDMLVIDHASVSLESWYKQAHSGVHSTV